MNTFLISVTDLHANGARFVIREDLAVGGRQIGLVYDALAITLNGVERAGDAVEVSSSDAKQTRWLSMILRDLGIEFRQV